MPDLHETLTAARDSVLDRVDMAKYWLRNAGRPYPPIEVLRATAVLGLNSNPTITAYTFENGVEHRHDANPLTKVMAAFAEQRDHWECPRLCELCGEQLASTQCPECHGSGCNAPACEASGAYAECEHCAGVGWVHEGCAEASYADLVAEVKELRGAIESIRDIVSTALGKPAMRTFDNILAVIERIEKP